VHGVGRVALAMGRSHRQPQRPIIEAEHDSRSIHARSSRPACRRRRPASERRCRLNAPEIWDVIVVGAGPAGSTAAALLAAAGHRVLVLDKERFPRFHIGESLLPLCLPVLERLGIDPDPDAWLHKRGAQFVCETTNRRRSFDFADALPGPPRHAWQVDRAAFDERLLQRAVEFGAELRHDVKVLGVEAEADRVAVRGRVGRLHARYVVDASGQNRLLARQHGSAEPLLRFGRTAAFVHYEGLGDAAIDEIGEGNDIRIMITPHGWGWLIPLAGRRLSVGLVCREGEVAAKVIERWIGESPIIGRWTQGCRVSEVRTERNFSFANREPHGPRWACVGDAACFLDPVFSSGVSLAMVGASSAADRLAHALAEGTEADASLMAPHQAHMQQGYDTFAAMIDRFYNTRFVDHFILGPEARGAILREIVSVLAGDVWRTDSRFQDMLTRSRRAKAS
jgi:flavin-dependent dehydrogenase